MNLNDLLQQTFEIQQGAAARRKTPAAFDVVGGFLKISLGAPASNGVPLSRAHVKSSCLVATRGNPRLDRDPADPAADCGIIRASSPAPAPAAVAGAAAATASHLFLAAESCQVLLLLLQGESLAIHAPSLLAFEPSLSHTVRSAAAAGGASDVRFFVLQGSGYVALLSQGPPLTLAVDPGLPPLKVDPQCVVAWSANLVAPALAPAPGYFDSRDMKRKDFDNKLQLNFSQTIDGNRGYVILQPLEESSRNILATIRKMFTKAGSFTFRVVRFLTKR